MSAAARFLMGQIFPGLFPKPAESWWEKNRTEGILTATAAWMSRGYLPRAALTVAWPEFKGRIRAAGKPFWLFFGMSGIAWAAMTLVTCLLVRPRALSLVERVLTNEELSRRWAATFTETDVVYFTRFLDFVQSPTPWLHVLLGIPVLLLLAAMDLWVRRTPPTVLAFVVTAPLWMAIGIATHVAGLVFATSVYALAFPGLLDGGHPTALVPWWLWVTLVWVLAACKEVSQENPRLREFTSGLTHYSAVYTLTRGKLFKVAYLVGTLIFIVAYYLILWLPVLVFLLVSGKAFRRDKAASKANRDGDFAIEDDRRLRLDMLSKCKSFYESEGLNKLITDMNNHNRMYYTEKQRDLFDQAYANLVETVGYLERSVQRDQANRMSRP